MVDYDEIVIAFYDAILAAGITDDSGVVIPIAWPNVKYDGGKPYFRINHLPNPSIAVGIKSLNMYEGFIQVDVVVAQGVGGVAPIKYAKEIAALFPRNTHLFQGSTKIGINKPGYVSPAVQQPDGYFIPVNIPYRVLTK